MDRRRLMETHRSQRDLDLAHAELHDLCQPLTALQCQLEMSRIELGDASLEEVVEDALKETHRLFAVIERMRSRLAEIEEQVQEQQEIVESGR